MNKTMEYMAFELPVVAFDLKETRVSADNAATYVPPNDVAAYARAISELLDDPERRGTWVNRAGNASWMSSRGGTRRRTTSKPTSGSPTSFAAGAETQFAGDLRAQTRRPVAALDDKTRERSATARHCRSRRANLDVAGEHGPLLRNFGHLRVAGLCSRLYA